MRHHCTWCTDCRCSFVNNSTISNTIVIIIANIHCFIIRTYTAMTPVSAIIIVVIIIIIIVAVVGGVAIIVNIIYFFHAIYINAWKA